MSHCAVFIIHYVTHILDFSGVIFIIWCTISIMHCAFFVMRHTLYHLSLFSYMKHFSVRSPHFHYAVSHNAMRRIVSHMISLFYNVVLYNAL